MGKKRQFWSPDSACRDADNKIFFSGSESEAKNICHDCPVKADCLDYAILHEAYGVFGETGRKERIAMRRNLGPQLLVEALQKDWLESHHLMSDSAVAEAQGLVDWLEENPTREAPAENPNLIQEIQEFYDFSQTLLQPLDLLSDLGQQEMLGTHPLVLRESA